MPLLVKVAGWVITPDVAKEWVAHHPEVGRQYEDDQWSHMATTCLHDFLELRGTSTRRLICTCWPKVSPTSRGRDLVLWIHAFQQCEGETWDHFAPIKQDDQSRTHRERLEKDGLKGELEWVTVPGPLEVGFPFWVRHPGEYPAPEPYLYGPLARARLAANQRTQAPPEKDVHSGADAGTKASGEARPASDESETSSCDDSFETDESFA